MDILHLYFISFHLQVFVRACSDCTEGEIASLVGIARNRLGVFLQVTPHEYKPMHYLISSNHVKSIMLFHIMALYIMPLTVLSCKMNREAPHIAMSLSFMRSFNCSGTAAAFESMIHSQIITCGHKDHLL